MFFHMFLHVHIIIPISMEIPPNGISLFHSLQSLHKMWWCTWTIFILQFSQHMGIHFFQLFAVQKTVMNIFTYKGIPIKLSDDFSAETLQARRKWHSVFTVMKGKNLQPRILYSARISFRFNREIQSFTDKPKLREFSTTRPALQQMLQELL